MIKKDTTIIPLHFKTIAIVLDTEVALVMKPVSVPRVSAIDLKGSTCLPTEVEGQIGGLIGEEIPRGDVIPVRTGAVFKIDEKWWVIHRNIDVKDDDSGFV